MKKIIIEVPETIASKWNELDLQKKKEINDLMAKIIAQSVQVKGADYWEKLREIRKSADSLGFSDEILNQILNEE